MLALLCAASALAGAGDLRVAVAARSIQPGELVVLTITTNAAVDALRARAFDREAPVYRTGAREWRALIGIDLGARPGSVTVAIDATSGSGAVHTTRDLQVHTRTFPTRTLHVDEAFVNPPPAMAERIAREAEDLRRLWLSPARERLWDGPFIRPVPGAAVSSFGTRSIFNGTPRTPHSGADFNSPSGTPIRAPAGGRIVLARDLYFSGNTIVIDHGQGLFSLLAHLSLLGVHEGDIVSAGQVVGEVGATGRVTGPHLHWAVRLAGARVDPLAVLALLGAD